MSTLVDELLHDFEDSGSEAGDDRHDGLLGDDDDEAAALMGTNGDVEMDAADLLSSDEDEEMTGIGGRVDDDEDTKAKVDKMQLGGISDIRSVAGLIKTLEPVLEVSPALLLTERDEAFTSLCRSNSPNSLAAALQKIAFYQSQPSESQAANSGNVEDHPE